MEKVWKDIIGFEGYYQISNSGEVKSLGRHVKSKGDGVRYIKAKEIPLRTKPNGYQFLQLHKNRISKNFYIHRLVALHFIPNPNNYSDVNHVDGNKTNNHITNLEWVTHSQNMIHAYVNNLKKVGEEHQQAKLTNDQVRYIRDNYKPFDKKFSAKLLALEFGVSASTVCEIANGLKRVQG